MKRLRLKLLMPHTFILALLVIGVVVSFVGIISSRKQTEALYNGPIAIKSVAGTLEETLEAMQTSVYRAISNSTQDITDEAIADARSRAEILQEQIARLKQYTLRDLGALSRLESILSELAPMQEQVLALAAQNKQLQATAYMENRNAPVIDEAQKELAQYIRSAEAKEQELVASLRQTQKKVSMSLIALFVIGTVFAVRDGTYFWRLYKGLRQKSEQYHPEQIK